MIRTFSRRGNSRLKTSACFAALAVALASARGDDPAASRNIDKALEQNLSVEWKAEPLEKVFADLREKTRSNLVVNWAALEKAAVNRDGPVTLRLRDVPFENVIKSVLLAAAPRDAGLNYVVGDNTVEITTNADLDKSSMVRLYEVAIILDKGGGSAAATLKELVHAALLSANEKIDPTGVVIQDGVLGANVSRRGDAIVRRFLLMFAEPVRLNPRQGSVPGVAESVRAKKASDALRLYFDGAGTHALTKLAAEGSETNLNTLVLPDARKVIAAGNEPEYLIDEAGIVEIGSPAEIAARVLPGVYDVSDLIRRRAVRSKTSADAELPKVAAELKAAVTSAPWGDPGSAPASITIYGRDLVIFAPAKAHRDIAQKLQELSK